MSKTLSIKEGYILSNTGIGMFYMGGKEYLNIKEYLDSVNNPIPLEEIKKVMMCRFRFNTSARDELLRTNDLNIVYNSDHYKSNEMGKSLMAVRKELSSMSIFDISRELYISIPKSVELIYDYECCE